MGMKAWLIEVVPIAAMVVVECLDVGLSTLSKAAMSRGMNHFVFVVYSNALASVILFTSSFLFHRSCFLFSFPLPSIHSFWISANMKQSPFFCVLFGLQEGQTSSKFLSHLQIFPPQPGRVCTLSFHTAPPRCSWSGCADFCAGCWHTFVGFCAGSLWCRILYL